MSAICAAPFVLRHKQLILKTSGLDWFCLRGSINKEIECTFELYKKALSLDASNIVEFALYGAQNNKKLAVLLNVGKDRRVWNHLGKLLLREGTEPQVSAMFHRVVVQKGLLFGAEIFLSEAMLGDT